MGVGGSVGMVIDPIIFCVGENVGAGVGRWVGAGVGVLVGAGVGAGVSLPGSFRRCKTPTPLV
jgi:hypothetical protein